MARTRKTVYQKIEETKIKITSTENTLSQLYSRLKELENQREELEMKQVWVTIKSHGLSPLEVQNILVKNS